MIEVVRSCLITDDIASNVDFISFGTNDLTQATFSFRAEKILKADSLALVHRKGNYSVESVSDVGYTGCRQELDQNGY